MTKVREFRSPVERKRPSGPEWEFREAIGRYEIQATEYVIDGKAAWLVKAEEKTYWAENGHISFAKFQAPSIEKCADPVDMSLQGCICEALAKFEKLAVSQQSAQPAKKRI